MEKRNSRSHFKIELGVLKPKKSYETEKEALKIARFLNTQENIIHKMIAYKCSTCGKWHIGNNGSELSEEDRILYRKLLQREQKWGI